MIPATMHWPGARVLITGGSGFIGTHLVARLLELGCTVRNLDVRPPNVGVHGVFWADCDVADPAATRSLVVEFQPTHVVHLAARVDTDADDFAAYAVNVDGTRNVLNSVRETPSVGRLVVTSTQFVVRPGRTPAGDTHWDPHTAYGESKVRAEQLTRDADLPCAWTIVRPTNVWGPWHPRYPRQFWRMLERGLYLHPAGRPALRSYGYVRNVVFQIEQVLRAPKHAIDRQVFYLGDRPLLLDDYVHGFARALTGRPARIAPYPVLRALALAGDVARLAGLRLPLTSSRLRSMTQDDPTPVERTITRFGEPPVTLDEGIVETVRWLRDQRLVDAPGPAATR